MMEYFWYMIASLGAGIGTGLAGLSAATVMVPVLIVLCPSFGGETGAYQATAIALASDILGSAVTAWTYARHKNIDLKRGWIMLVCILVMCTAGSYAAWLAGNFVLGSFTLFLTFFIGIRFLVKPDTSRDQTVSKGASLDWKGVCVSLFFGLTIGFGTGFVGTGGGMMMLVVFTVFLGMELKTAVGTSTFIMTFTALIASVSHVLIHPAIVLERWPVLLLCMFTATLASLVSARFANRVSSRTVGLVTGVVLTVLGAAMILLFYREYLTAIPLYLQVMHCLRDFIVFIIPCVLGLLVIRFLFALPQFVFRKCLHLVAFSCVTMMIAKAESWAAASLTSCLIAVVIYPLLRLVEKEPWYSPLFVEKEPGEIRMSLLLLFFMFAALTAVSWGLFGRREPAAAAILMWGTGDAMAALVGIPFGRHKVHWRLTDGKKSWEGTGVMFLTSLLTGLVFFLLYCHMPGSVWFRVAWAALAGALTELVSPSEWDTVTVPAVILAVLLVCGL